jgi:hypothetical protein
MQRSTQDNVSGDQPDFVAPPTVEDPSRLAKEGVEAFNQIIETIGEIRSLQVEATNDLGSFAALARGPKTQDRDPLDALTDCLETMHAALVSFCEGHTGNDARMEQIRAKHCLDIIACHGKTLSAIATLSRTAAASYGLSEFETYLIELSRVSEDIGTASLSVTERVVELTLREHASVETCLEARDLLKSLLPIVANRATQIAALSVEEDKAADEISLKSDGLVETNKQHLKSFVTAIQFSDRLSQRLEHLSDMLIQKSAGVGPLAAAQAKHIANDVRDVANEVSATMERLSQTWREGAELYWSGEIAQSIERSLDTRGQTVELIVAKLDGVSKAIHSTGEDAKVLPETIAAANENFSLLQESAQEVANSAMNSTLIAARSGSAKDVMGTLSHEVRETASKCLEDVKLSQLALNAVGERGSFGLTELATTGSALEESVVVYEAEIGTGRARLADIDNLRASASKGADSLVGLVQTAIESMARVVSISDRLDALAAELEQNPESETPDPAVLSAIWNNYTMSEERDVHVQVFGAPDEPGQVAAQSDADSDEIDDVFF